MLISRLCIILFPTGGGSTYGGARRSRLERSDRSEYHEHDEDESYAAGGGATDSLPSRRSRQQAAIQEPYDI